MNGLVPPGLARHLEQLPPGLGQLVVDEHVGFGEAFAINLASPETSCEHFPGRPRLEVVEPDDIGGVVAMLLQDVAGRDVRGRHLDTRLQVNQTETEAGSILLSMIALLNTSFKVEQALLLRGNR